MARGLFFGIIWGGLFTALFLAVVSLLAPMPNPQTQMADPQPVQSTTGVMPEEDPTPTPQMSSPSIEDSPSMGETTSAIMPSHGEAESSLDTVSEASEPAPNAAVSDEPSVASQTEAPSAPATESSPSVAVETVEPMTVDTSATSQASMESIEVVEVAQDSQTFEPDAPMSEDTSIVTDRLPTITSSDSAPAEEPEAGEAEDNRPLMAIVLIDTGEFNIGPEALASFPYPITFAIDPLREDAIEAADKYAAKGFELLLTADLPQNGDASLPELAIKPTLESFEGITGVLEGTDGGLQGNMALAEGMLNMIESTDYGLVLRAKGLNAAQQQANGRNLPVDTVFRDFDGAGQNASVIRRFLDQAAFKARQEGSVIMVGRLRPATISALLLWGLQDRATSVRLTPISEVLAQ